MVAMTEIKRAAKKLGDKARAERVILFGSYARGQAGDHSDVDLLIIAESDLPRPMRSRELYGLFRPIRSPWTCWSIRRKKWNGAGARPCHSFPPS